MISTILCGPSKSELEAREKTKSDSIAQETQYNKERELVKQNSISAELIKQKELKLDLINLKIQLIGEQSKLTVTEKWKFGRGDDKKALQIASHEIIIKTIKAKIKEIEKQITL